MPRCDAIREGGDLRGIEHRLAQHQIIQPAIKPPLLSERRARMTAEDERAGEVQSERESAVRADECAIEIKRDRRAIAHHGEVMPRPRGDTRGGDIDIEGGPSGIEVLKPRCRST